MIYVLYVLGALVAALLFVKVFIDFERFFDAPPPSIEVSDAARTLHDSAIPIDLHCDCMLWERDLLKRNPHGSVDLPRMEDGGLWGLAVTIPTTRIIGLQGWHRGWPARTWVSHWERYRFQIETTRKQIESSDKLALARTAADVRANRERGVRSIFHGIEGANALKIDQVELLDVAKQDGVLFVGPVHFFDNEFGGHGGGAGKGLTDLGRELIRKMNACGMLLDTAHASTPMLQEAVELSAFPPINSHTGVKAVYDHWRNLPDGDIRAIAANNGVVGIMFGGMALSKPDPNELVDHMQHVIDLVGEDHVALGSDWDGYVTPAVDAAGLPQLTQLMLDRGWSDERIRKILGDNFLRVWAERDAILAARAG